VADLGNEFLRAAYGAIHRADADELRPLVADDAYWQPSSDTPRHPAEGGDEVAKRLAWRGAVHHLRLTSVVSLGGDRAVVTLVGRRMHYLGARFWDRRIYQVVTMRNGKIARIEDYRRHRDALAAAGVQVSE
jgi:ketosteroid isomerase-like protein